jgi:hypothetical protein
MWDLWRTQCQSDNFFPCSLAVSCHCHSTHSPYSIVFIHHRCYIIIATNSVFEQIASFLSRCPPPPSLSTPCSTSCAQVIYRIISAVTSLTFLTNVSFSIPLRSDRSVLWFSSLTSFKIQIYPDHFLQNISPLSIMNIPLTSFDAALTLQTTREAHTNGVFTSS